MAVHEIVIYSLETAALEDTVLLCRVNCVVKQKENLSLDGTVHK